MGIIRESSKVRIPHVYMPSYTTYARTDGFGAQFQNIIFDILYTLAHGETYVFTPIQSLEHNYNGDAEFADRLNKFMNLADAFPPQTDKDAITVIPPQLYPSHAYVYSWVERNINSLIPSAPLDYIKNTFFANKTSPYDNKFHNLCVHLRRKNPHDSRNEGTNLPTQWYKHAIYKILDELKTTKPVCIHIVSQGSQEDFEEILSHLPVNSKLYLNESVEDSFLQFVYCDTLLCAQSSFSYIAACLTNAKVYYCPFWHAAHSAWTAIPW